MKAWKKVKLHGAQTPDVAGTIFEGKWNCMMLKLAFEPEHALEVEEITGFSNTITGRLIWEMGLEEDKITWYSNIRQLANQTGLEGCEIAWFSNNSVPFICYTLDLEGCEIAGCSNTCYTF